MPRRGGTWGNDADGGDAEEASIPLDVGDMASVVDGSDGTGGAAAFTAELGSPELGAGEVLSAPETPRASRATRPR
jgi:hypothetical protein